MNIKRNKTIIIALLLAYSLFSNNIFAEEVSINSNSGFYKSPFLVQIASETVGANIKYTLDGSNPISSLTAIEGISPLEILINPSDSSNRALTPAIILRAISFNDVNEPSSIITRTYIFIDYVKIQKYPGGQWSDIPINKQLIDLDMDTVVVKDSLYRDLINDALLDIPTISLVSDIKNFFDPEIGIYVNAKEHGIDWERPVNVELINPDKSLGFSIDAGMRIRGGWSRHADFPKHSFRLFFRKEYGFGKLEFPLFGNEGVDEFEKIDLRTSQNYAWSCDAWHGKFNTMNRDVFSRDIQRDMKQTYTRSRYYHLYINGMYWGVFQTQERGEANFAESYLGGDKDDYDVIKVNAGDDWDIYEIEATDGNLDVWNKIWEKSEIGFKSNENYFNLIGLDKNGQYDNSLDVWVDIDNLIDYMLIIFYTGNFDCPTSKFGNNSLPSNIYAINNRNRKLDGFKFLIHDAEHTLFTQYTGTTIGLEENRVNIGSIEGEEKMIVDSNVKFHPQWLHYKLSENLEYRLRFADRVYKHFYNNGVFTPEICQDRFLATANKLNLAIIAESARWGDTKVEETRTRDEDWLPAINNIIDNYFPFRGDIVLQQLIDEQLYFEILPPTFKHNNKEINVSEVDFEGSFTLTLKNSKEEGNIIFTTDGNDPRSIGGEISEFAQISSSAKTININKSCIIKARIKLNEQWSALHKLYIYKNTNISNLKITELHYHPINFGDIDGRELEFIEIKNTAITPLNISGLTFTDGITYTFPEATILPAQSFIVLSSNKSEFANLHGFEAFDQYIGHFSNGGEKVELSTSNGEIVFAFEYFDDGPWETDADGKGASLVSVKSNPIGDPNHYSYWQCSSNIHGSPNADDISSNTKEDFYNQISIFPNPIYKGENMTIELNPEFVNFNIKIYNVKGILVANYENKKSISITNNYSIGTYLLIIEVNGTIISRNKFIVK